VNSEHLCLRPIGKKSVEKKLGLAARLAACIRAGASPNASNAPAFERCFRLRMFAIAGGYEDAGRLRFAPARSDIQDGGSHAPESGDPLCSQPTMSRLDNAPSKIEIAR